MGERATCHDHDQYYWVDEGCPVCVLSAALSEAQATIARLEAALTLASKRLSACARTLDRESEMHKAALWAHEARAALSPKTPGAGTR